MHLIERGSKEEIEDTFRQSIDAFFDDGISGGI